MKVEVFGIDGGNFETKVCYGRGVDCFSSIIGERVQRTASDIHSNQDMDFSIIGKYEEVQGFCGPLASIESEYGGTVFGITKNHADARVRILLAIHRNIQGKKVCVVVGQPYKGHTETEKNDIIESLKGPWDVTINGERKQFEIEDVKVGIEGAMAFLSSPFMGPVNIIDVGSGTINCIHFLNKKIVDRKSNTLQFGSETNKNGVNYEGMASGIFKQMSAQWDKDNPTFVCGGSASMMVPVLQKYYPLVQIMPVHTDFEGIKMSVNAKFANAVGMYAAGVILFGKLQTC